MEKPKVKIAILTLICLALYVVDVDMTSSDETKSENMLPPIVAQTYGPAGTIIMWHDTDDDGNPDHKATYNFKGWQASSNRYKLIYRCKFWIGKAILIPL